MLILVLLMLFVSGVLGWLDDFKRRQNIDLTNLLGLPQPHSLLDFSVNTENLTSSGKIRRDCLDVMFTNSQDTPFDHWLESSCGFSETKFWINVTNILPIPIKTRMRMYYGSTSIYVGKYPAKKHWSSRLGLMSRVPCSSIGLNSFSELDGYFVMGNSSEFVNEAFGSSTHQHRQPNTINSDSGDCDSSTNLEMVSFSPSRSSKDHTHTLTLPGGSMSSPQPFIPKYRRYSFCYPSTNDSFPFPIPNGTLGMFESTDGISDWSSDEELNTNRYFVNGAVSSFETYDPPQHRHTLDYTGVSWSDSGDCECKRPSSGGSGMNLDICRRSHVHTLDTCYSEYEDVDARYCNLYGMQATQNTSFPSNMITFQYCGDNDPICGDPPFGFRRYQELDGYLLRGSSTNLKDCVIPKHSHSFSDCTTSGPCTNDINELCCCSHGVCKMDHTHTFQGEIQEVEVVPPHKKVRFLMRIAGDDGVKVTYEILDGEDWNCFNTSKDSEDVCNFPKGACVDPDVCECDNSPYETTRITGQQCEVFDCFGLLMNDTEVVCGGTGDCVSPDVCVCKYNFTHPVEGSDDCTSWECFGVDKALNELVCNGHGNCSSHDQCDCVNETEYHIDEDCGFSCYTVPYKDDSEVCSGRGYCVDVNECVCKEGFSGDDCSKYICYNISATDTVTVCGGHGSCVGVDDCNCLDGYYTPSGFHDVPCSSWSCYGVHKDVKTSICSSHGECKAHDLCWCKFDFEGLDCETWSCGNDDHKNPKVCSGNGKCWKPSSCKCKSGYRGKICEQNMMYYTVLLPTVGSVGVSVVIVVIIIFCVCACCAIVICCLLILAVVGLCMGISVLGINLNVQKLRLSKLGRLKNFDLLLKEQELDADTSIAHLRIKEDMFKIDYNEIKLLSILGEGGSNSVVYKSEWNGSIVAFKVFRTRTVFSNQETYDEFEREVEVLASISNPGIIQFFGCSMQPPRVGIVMEFCEKGDLNVNIQNYEIHNGNKYPFREKCRLALEISQALEYLHARNIIHRDLKLENVLVDSREKIKLMDFGLSKIVDRMSQVKTKKIGTSYYMAPEIVLSSKYDELEMGVSIELRVANDHELRPKIEELDAAYEKRSSLLTLIREIITNCWSHDPNQRFGFRVISKKLKEEMMKSQEEKEKEEEKVEIAGGKKALKMKIDFDDDDDDDGYEMPQVEEGEDGKRVMDRDKLCNLGNHIASRSGDDMIEIDVLISLLNQGEL